MEASAKKKVSVICFLSIILLPQLSDSMHHCFMIIVTCCTSTQRVKYPSMNALFYDCSQLMTFWCISAFKVTVDGGPNGSALVWLNPSLLYILREVISFRDVECCEAEITGSYLHLLSQVWELLDQGNTDRDLRATGLTSTLGTEMLFHFPSL